MKSREDGSMVGVHLLAVGWLAVGWAEALPAGILDRTRNFVDLTSICVK